MSGSGGSGQQFAIRLALDGAEAVESGLRRVQATAAQSGQAIQQAGESTGRAMTVIERGTAAASQGLVKLGGDFAALAPVIDNAGGAVGRMVAALGAGAGLLGALGGVAAAVTAAVALYQNWDAASRAVGSAVDFLTGRVQLNAEAITAANDRLREFLRLSESAASAGVRGQVQQQAGFAEGFRNDRDAIDRNIAALEAGLSRAQAGGATGRLIERGGASGLVPTDEFGRAADRAAQDRLAQQRQAEIDRIQADLRVARAERARVEAARQQAEGNIAALGEAAGTVINPIPTPTGEDIPRPPRGAGGGGGGGRAAAPANDALRERDALLQRNITAEERYAQGMGRIADLNDRLIAQGNDPLPDEQVQREAVRLMEEYERATQRAGDSTRNLTDDSREFARLATGTAKALSGAFEDLVFEGKNFDDVLKDLERSLLRLGNQFFLQPLFQQGLNSLFGAAGGGGAGGGAGGGGGVGGIVGSIASSLFGGGGGSALATTKGAVDALQAAGTFVTVFHDGGTVGAAGVPSRFVSAEMFADAPRYHSGGIIGPDERPIIAQVGERVLNRKEAADYARGGAVTININGVRDPNEFRQSQSQITASLARAIGRSSRNR